VGKHTDLDLSLTLLRPGGLYICDDVKPEPDWPVERFARVQRTIAELGTRPGVDRVYIPWRSGVVILAKTAALSDAGAAVT